MSKLFKDANGEFQIEAFNGTTYPVYDNKGDRIFMIGKDGHTPVYNNMSQMQNLDVFSPLLNSGIYASPQHSHAIDPIDHLPMVIKRK